MWPLIGAIAVSLVALLLAQSTAAQQRRFVWLAGLCGVLVLAGLAVEQELIRLLLLEAAAFGAVGLLVANGVEKAARNAYLGAAALSAIALVAATLLLPSGPAGLVLALFMIGFAVKLALVPTYLWLPMMAAPHPGGASRADRGGRRRRRLRRTHRAAGKRPRGCSNPHGHG